PLATQAAVLDARIAGGARVSDLVDHEVVAVDAAHLLPAFADYGEFTAALETLAGVPRDRLELLLGETLDCCSHRLDAWLMAVADRRLADLRRARPTGLSLGGYGVVEGLARRPPRPAAVDPPAGVPDGTVTDPANAGYVHAPS